MADLKQQFSAFASYGKTGHSGADMDGKNFSKLCKDCHLIGPGLTATDVDLVFAKVKDKAARVINYAQFGNALDEIAKKKGCSKDEIAKKICEAAGPTSNATKADNVKFHDDKSLYTGVHAKGGPTTVDNKTADLSNMMNRKTADIRGVEPAAYKKQ